MVYEYFLEGQYVEGYKIHKEEDRPDLIGNPEPPQDMLDNGFTDENGNYKFVFENNVIIESDIINVAKDKMFNKLKSLSCELLKNALLLDKIKNVTTNFNQAKTFLQNKKTEIQNGTNIKEILEIEKQIKTQINSALDQIAQEL